MIPGADDLWFLPLGGTGEIGMNFNLYGHDGRWLAVDCGVMFGNEHVPGPPVQMANPDFIASRRDQLSGLVVTHAHEDHVGGVAWLWNQLRCPVYTTPFTAEVLRRKLAEAGLVERVPVNVLQRGDRVNIDVFDVEWVSLTHSIPEPNALFIRTAAGNVFHTADWKLDPDPVIGEAYSEAAFRRLAAQGVAAMVCDSTNATLPGHSRSEGELYEGLRQVIGEARGRVVVGCFGSNVARLHTLARVAKETGRSMGLLGRSLYNITSAARSAGIWQADIKLIAASDLGYFPRDEVLVVATGSQGESRAALGRLAHDRHPDLSLDHGDTVVFSSKVIPGNERSVERLVGRLEDMGVHVVTADDASAPIHASGHPAEDELAHMYEWIRPRIAIPTHGEDKHLRANADIARAVGVPVQLVGENGDLFVIAPQPAVRRRVARVGRLGLTPKGLAAVAT
ncbi:MAG: ribonuclease J [Pseudomonadota bacterium]